MTEPVQTGGCLYRALYMGKDAGDVMQNIIKSSQYRFNANNTIRERSAIAFTTPSLWAAENLLYIQMYGNFVCDERYEVRRGSFDSYLLILTISGGGMVETPHGTRKCSRETITIIDCHEEHSYYADKKWEFLWIHFNGGNSRELVKSIIRHHGNVVYMPITSLTHRFFNLLVFQGVGNTQADEVRNSAYLHFFLADMLSSRTEKGKIDTKREMVNEAIGYIESNYRKKLTVDEIARFSRSSTSSFCHEFKKETGMSPYDFILNKRLNKAKKLLKTTDASVSEIGEAVGFNSDANFIKTFRAKTGLTPKLFRDQLNGPVDMGGIL